MLRNLCVNIARTGVSVRPRVSRLYSSTGSIGPDVPFAEFNTLVCLGQGENQVYVIDVREPAELTLGKVPSSINIPLSQVETAFDEWHDDDWRRAFHRPKPTESCTVIMYCRSGVRSHQACAIAASHGFKTRNYKGSWLLWNEKHNLGAEY